MELFLVQSVYVPTAHNFFLHLAPAYTVSFNHSAYGVNESNGQAVLVISLNRLPLTDVTVVVFTTDGSATGKNVHCILY